MYELYAIKRSGGGWTAQHWFEPRVSIEEAGRFPLSLCSDDITDSQRGTQRSHKTNVCKRCESLQAANTEDVFVNREAEAKARREAQPNYAKPRPQKNKASRK